MDRIISRADGEISAGNGHLSRRVNGIVLSRQIQAAGFDIEISVRIFHNQAVILRFHCEVGLPDSEALLYMHGIPRSSNADATAGKHHIVISVNPVLISAGNRKAAAAVDRQIVACENRAAPLSRKRFRRSILPAGKPVFRPLRQRHEYLFRLFDPEAGIVIVENLHPVQQQPHLGTPVGIHNDAAILQLPGEHVFPRIGNHQIPVIEIGSFAGNTGGRTFERDHICGRAVPFSVHIICREIDRPRMVFRIFINDHLDAEAFSVHEKDGEHQREEQHDNADFIKTRMR